MSFGEAIKSVFTQYASFSGRARRSEYWYFVLFNIIASAVVSAVAGLITGGRHSSGIAIALPAIYSLAVLVPSIAVCIRRLHDIGKSGWFYLLFLIPCVGQILMIIWFVQDSEPGINAYGPNPKEGKIQY